jgi:hypothetical protein
MQRNGTNNIIRNFTVYNHQLLSLGHGHKENERSGKRSMHEGGETFVENLGFGDIRVAGKIILK